jgi:hypothetical protein
MNQYYQKMKETNKALQEENQLLKFKLDILLDMVRLIARGYNNNLCSFPQQNWIY